MKKRGIALDLGTASTLLYETDRDTVLNEPTIAALDKETGKVLSAGAPARVLFDREPEKVDLVYPLQEGVIADYTTTQAIVSHFLSRVSRFPFLNPRVLLAVPAGITPVEKKALLDMVRACGIDLHRTYLVCEPVASALGGGLKILEPKGRMVVDIGGGTAQIAVLSLGHVVCSQSVRCAGNAMDEAIRDGVRREKGIDISLRQAEQIKISVGTAICTEDTPNETVSMVGTLVSDGKKVTQNITSQEVCGLLQDVLTRIARGVTDVLRMTSPQLCADLMEEGIVLAGGCSQLRGLGAYLQGVCGLEVKMASDPQKGLIHGAALMLQDFSRYESILEKAI